MLLVAPVARERWRTPQGLDVSAGGKGADVMALVNQVRSDIPAVTHVDWSARIQTVHADTNPRYHRIISEFAELTGCPTIINTSFNVRGEPIVCTPEDAYRCFMRTEMDTLVLGNHVLLKSAQPALAEAGDWRHEFQLD
jgi:carbamoyltransferase